MDREIYLFIFSDPLERDEVLEKEPWLFSRSLIILKPTNDVRDT